MLASVATRAPSLRIQGVLKSVAQQDCFAIGLAHTPSSQGTVPQPCWLLVSPQRLTDDNALQFFTKAKHRLGTRWTRGLSRLDVYDGGRAPTPPLLVHSNALLGWAMGSRVAEGLYVCHLHDAAEVPRALMGGRSNQQLNADNAFVVFGYEMQLPGMGWQDASSNAVWTAPPPLLPKCP